MSTAKRLHSKPPASSIRRCAGDRILPSSPSWLNLSPSQPSGVTFPEPGQTIGGAQVLSIVKDKQMTQPDKQKKLRRTGRRELRLR